MGGVGFGRAFQILVFLALMIFPTKTISNNNSSSNALCIEIERHALLRFKKELKDPSNRLSSWILEVDCCKWVGVHCDSLTGHIKELKLANRPYIASLTEAEEISVDSNLKGNLSDSILNLKHISHIDLSYNDFGGIQIPSFLGSLVSLNYLNLTKSGFQGLIPHQLGNLSNLQRLGLGGNPLYSENLRWVQSLHSLVSLDLSFVHLSKVSDWLLDINNLPFLQELRLSDCHLNHITHLSEVNFTSLSILDISSNDFHTVIPEWISKLGNLVSLDLSQNGFQGPLLGGFSNLTSLENLHVESNYLNSSLPKWLFSLTSMTSLNLHANVFEGRIPECLGNLSSLEYLDLSSNELSGTLPKSIGLLSSLRQLILFSNRLEGIITEAHFANLKSLSVLDMTENNVKLSFSVGWRPPFNLDSILLGSCNLGPQFPQWLMSQKNFYSVDLSNAKISDIVPDWFWNLSTSYTYLNLSQNQLLGKIPDFLLNAQVSWIFLGSNKFHGNLPRISTNIIVLDLSNNSFFGNMSDFLCHPRSQKNQLEILDFGDNLLSGNIPDCWTAWRSLRVVELGNNFFSGKLPSSVGSLSKLESLHVRNNSLFGKIPRSLKSCLELKSLDLGLNAFEGNIPTWIGMNLSNLIVLGLRSNKLSGLIPDELCHLSSLQIVDIGNNNLTGYIPHCFGNFTAMAIERSSSKYIHYSFYVVESLENAYVTTKGNEFQYFKILSTLMTSMDLSDNNLLGEIPQEITNLFGLRCLNLSRNHLKGSIPQQIGSMTNMESLDLSRNQLLGQIPQSMPKLTFLNYLNLSYNNLSGLIPIGGQLQSFDRSSFIGNELCGQPSTNSCSSVPPDRAKEDDDRAKEDDDNYFDEWFYLSLTFGFVIGFWGIFGPLLICKTWRAMYFRHLGSLWQKLSC